jgi:predicted nucleic acid-binding protein
VFLLDTNVVSELRKVRPHGAVVAWIEGVADAELYLSAVTLGEIQAGI